MKSQPVLTFRNGLFYMRTSYREADLLFACEQASLISTGLREFIESREKVQSYVEKHPKFLYSLEPVKPDGEAPEVVAAAIDASIKAGVGPMAALPGALADRVLKTMVEHGAKTVIVENGGEVSMKIGREAVIGVYTGKGLNLGLIVDCSKGTVGVSTSSSSVSHALSLGEADAAVVVAENASLADAVSTRVGNMVKPECGESLKEAVDLALSIGGVTGCVVYSGGLLGFGGCVKPILLNASRLEVLESMMLKGPLFNFHLPI